MLASIEPLASAEVRAVKAEIAGGRDVLEDACSQVNSHLFRYNPAAEPGKKFTLDSKEPKGGYQEFLLNEARYNRLTREFPDRAKALFARNEAAALERYQHLLKLKDLYAEA